MLVKEVLVKEMLVKILTRLHLYINFYEFIQGSNDSSSDYKITVITVITISDYKITVITVITRLLWIPVILVIQGCINSSGLPTHMDSLNIEGFNTIQWINISTCAPSIALKAKSKRE